MSTQLSYVLFMFLSSKMIASLNNQEGTMEIPRKETLEIEFKSDSKRFPDKDLIEEAVAFSNTNGGFLYLGVEGVNAGLFLTSRG